jgi:hypothetical protein
MPEIEDFPHVGQREYVSKSDSYRSQDGGPRGFGAPASSSPPRKRGLLQRLVDAGRGRRPPDDVSQNVDAGRERPLPEDPTVPAFIKRDRG